jgi:hypothetical protein
MNYNELQNLFSKVIADIQLLIAEVSSIEAKKDLDQAMELVAGAKRNDFDD